MLWMTALSARGNGTIEQAITLAFRTHPDLKAAYHQYHISEERYAEARAGLFPTVDISATYGNGKQDVGKFAGVVEPVSCLPAYVVELEHRLSRGAEIDSERHLLDGIAIDVRVEVEKVDAYARGEERLGHGPNPLPSEIV